MSILKSNAITAVTNDTDVTITGAGTGGVAIGTHMKLAKGGDISSASPLVIDTDGTMFDVTGTTNFSVMTVEANRFFVLQFDGALTVTDGSSIVLPGNANVTTAAGDVWTCYATLANTVVVTSIETTAAPSSGGLVKITSTDISSTAAIAFTGFDASTYNSYMITLSCAACATDNKEIFALTSTDGGSSYDSSGYSWVKAHIAGDGTYSDEASTSDSQIKLRGTHTTGTVQGEEVNGNFYIFAADLTEFTRFTWSDYGANDGPAKGLYWGGGGRDTAADVDAIKFTCESGASWAAAGNMTFYGVVI